MRKRLIDLRGDEEPILDIASYGRPSVPLTRRQLTHIVLAVAAVVSASRRDARSRPTGSCRQYRTVAEHACANRVRSTPDDHSRADGVRESAQTVAHGAD